MRLFRSYAEALAECVTPHGYDSEFLSRYIARKSALYLERLTMPIHFPDHVAHTTLAATLVGRGARVLDFGGGCGIPYALLHRLGFSARWHVVEIPSLVNEASQRINVPGLSFTDSITRSRVELVKVDLVHTAGTLQCVDDPRAWLERLLEIQAEYFFVGRCGFTNEASDLTVIHRAPIRDHGFPVEMEHPEGTVEYPFTYMRKRDFDAMVHAAGYVPIATFDSNSGMHHVEGHSIVGGAFIFRLR